MPSFSREFVVRKDSLPMKIVTVSPDRLRQFMDRVRGRYPGHQWSVSERFLLNAGD